MRETAPRETGTGLFRIPVATSRQAASPTRQLSQTMPSMPSMMAQMAQMPQHMSQMAQMTQMPSYPQIYYPQTAPQFPVTTSSSNHFATPQPPSQPAVAIRKPMPTNSGIVSMLIFP
ncbi:hypothetical protein EON65_42535 [archaeon]|nr:MAG: hypothetical protein EON65_42535 [archaeon]